MKFLLLQLTSFLAGLSVGHCYNCSKSVEEGKSVQFNRTMTIYDLEFPLQWRVRTNLVWDYAGVCYNRSGQCEMESPMYEAFVLPIGGLFYIRSFILKSANVGADIVRVTDVHGYRDDCHVQVYVKPDTPACLPAVASSQNITLRCTIKNSYPLSICSFQYRGNNYDDSLSYYVTYDYNPSRRITHCTFVGAPKPLDYIPTFASDAYQFKVHAHPNVSGGYQYAVSNSWTDPVTAAFRIFTANSETGTVDIKDGDSVEFTCFTNQVEKLHRLELHKDTNWNLVYSTAQSKLTYTDRNVKCSKDQDFKYICMAKTYSIGTEIGSIIVKCSGKSSSDSSFPFAYVIVIIAVVCVGFGIFSGFCLHKKRKHGRQNSSGPRRTPGHHFAVRFPDRRGTTNPAAETNPSDDIDGVGSNNTGDRDTPYTISGGSESAFDPPPSYESVNISRDSDDLEDYVDSSGHHWHDMQDPPSYDSVIKAEATPSAPPYPGGESES